MKAIILKAYGEAYTAFEITETPVPEPSKSQILIKSEGFGLNFADVLARKGMYKPAPKPPCILGYEVVGKIVKAGSLANDLKEGDRVLAFTRFGAYAEYAIIEAHAAIKIPESLTTAKACALATQYATAYYAAYDLINLFAGQKVLIHAAAGGVGSALVQLCKLKGCEIFGTVGSEEKKQHILNQGVDYAINYLTHDFEKEIISISGKNSIDVIFDSIGGKAFNKSRALLSPGGKLISYGAAERTDKKWGILSTLNLLKNFGIIHPISLIMNSHSFLGVNLLSLADNKPETIARCLKKVMELYESGAINPEIGAVFNYKEISRAHHLLETRKTTGKIAVLWD